MLKEISRIAREMLFMQGHLTRPLDWADHDRADAPATPAKPVRRKRTQRALALAAACCATSPRLIVGQIR